MKKRLLFVLSFLFGACCYHLEAQNNSVQFDGVNDRISISGNTSIFNSANTLTVEAWINADVWKANSWQGTIVSKDQNNQSGYVLRCGNNGRLSFTVGVTSGWTEIVTTTPVMQANTWHHVAGVMDNGTLSIYVDGVQVGSRTSSPISTSVNSVYIGESIGFPGRVFDGRIDEVRIWNIARTQADISANMTVNLPGTTTGLIGYYKMDTIIGNQIVNEVGTASTNGDLQNFSAGNILVAGYAVPTFDIAASQISSPDLLSLFDGYTRVSGSFTNLGNDTITSVVVGYQVDANTPVTSTINQVLLPGEVLNHRFDEVLPQMDSTTKIRLFANLTGDVNANNDAVETIYEKPATPGTLEIPIFESKQHNFAGAGQSHSVGITLPGNNIDYSKITLEISLSCPSGGCDPWDQPAKISVVKGTETYEIARYITPYRLACGPWTVDVTDFKTLLRGYTEFASYIQVWGNSGWLLDAKLIYEKNPVQNPYHRLTRLWATDNWVYGDPNISYDLPAQSVKVDSNTNEVDMRMTITGHGQGNTLNAAEFVQRTHTVMANNAMVTNQFLWKNDCAQNPCANQFGTWTLSRAGWCPGEAVDPFMVNLTAVATPNQNVNVDYVLQPYVNQLNTGYNGGSHTEPHYKIHAYLVQRSDRYIDSVSFTDLAATEITSPTLANLTNGTPVKVMLRNYGSTTVSNPNLSLWVNGVATASERALANIAPGDSLEYTFTTAVPFSPNTSYNIVVLVNTLQDEASSNDVANEFLDVTVGLNESKEENHFSIYPNPSSGFISLEGNFNSKTTTVQIFNANGQEVFSRDFEQVKNKLQINTDLAGGTYIIKLSDGDAVEHQRLVITND